MNIFAAVFVKYTLRSLVETIHYPILVCVRGLREYISVWDNSKWYGIISPVQYVVTPVTWNTLFILACEIEK